MLSIPVYASSVFVSIICVVTRMLILPLRAYIRSWCVPMSYGAIGGILTLFGVVL